MSNENINKHSTVVEVLKVRWFIRVGFTQSMFGMIWQQTIFTLVAILNFLKSLIIQTIMKTKWIWIRVYTLYSFCLANWALNVSTLCETYSSKNMLICKSNKNNCNANNKYVIFLCKICGKFSIYLHNSPWWHWSKHNKNFLQKTWDLTRIRKHIWEQ